MADYLYTADGAPQGFRLGSYIYGLDGKAIGRVWAERAYRLDGAYVGALLKNMVVDKPSVSRRNLPPLPHPSDVRPAVGAEPRRPLGDQMPDVFALLTAGADEADEAAER